MQSKVPLYPYGAKLDTNFDTMRILIGVQFLLVKPLSCKAFPILFNNNGLCGCSEMGAAEPFCIFAHKPFNKRSFRVCIF